MALGWNEIKERAQRFSKEWETAFNEEADAKQFLIEFFNIFGISNRRVATFEHRVKVIKASPSGEVWRGTATSKCYGKGPCWLK
jgi:hypothetical protein